MEFGHFDSDGNKVPFVPGTIRVDEHAHFIINGRKFGTGDMVYIDDGNGNSVEGKVMGTSPKTFTNDEGSEGFSISIWGQGLVDWTVDFLIDDWIKYSNGTNR